MGNLKKTIHLGAINEILALVVGFYSSYSLDKILSDAIKTLGFSKVLKDAEIHRPYRDVYFQFAEDDKLDLLKQIQSEVRESVSSFQKLRLQEALNETILKYIAHPTEFSKLFGESATFKWNQLEPESRKRAKDRIVCHRKNPQIAFEDSFLTIRINDKSLKLKPQAIPIMEKLIKDYFIGGLGLNKKQLLSHDPEYGNKISDKLSGTVKSNKCTDSDLYEYSDQTGVYRLPIEY